MAFSTLSCFLEASLLVFMLAFSAANAMPLTTVVLPLYGDADDDGRFYVKVKVGDQQRTFSLDIDTGSDLIWLKNTEYMPPREDIVDREEPICVDTVGRKRGRDRKCYYSMKYADDSSSNGYLVRDDVSLESKNGVRKARLVIGRGDARGKAIPTDDFDGLLGLGKKKASLVSQLGDQGIARKIFGHCLSGKGGGYLFVGADAFDPSKVTWAPMSTDPGEKDGYIVAFGALLFDGKPTSARRSFPVLFDSGASRTFIKPSVYEDILKRVTEGLSGSPLTKTDQVKNFEACWRGKGRIENIDEVKKYFKSITLRFSESTKYTLEAQDYLFLIDKEMVCLTLDKGDPKVGTLGANSMLDRIVVYDNENQRIGWVPANCDKAPSGKSIDFIVN